jgi:hypothetical protein
MVVGVALAGCEGTTDPTDPVVCTAIAISSLNVTVRDRTTSERLCDASVVAVQSGTTYELRLVGTAPSCSYAGPEERSGAFELRVSRPGYSSAVVPNIQVGRDECHVIPVLVTVDLQPS